MDLEDPPKTLVGTIAAVQFPVYGIVGRPLDLTYSGRWVTTGCIPFLAIVSITLDFMSPRYPSYLVQGVPFPNFRVQSELLQYPKLGNWSSLLDLVVQEQGQPERNPFFWEGSLSIAGTLFHGKMRYYATPLKLSEYHLVSEKGFVGGYAAGPSCDELIELLEGLEVLNGRDELIRQQYTSH